LRAHDDSVVIYPKVGLWEDGSHHNLIFNFFGDYRRPDVARSDPSVLMDEIAATLAASNLNVVISSETLAWHPDIGRLIDAFIGLSDPGSISVEVIVVCREHFERAASMYNQRVKDPVSCERGAPDPYLRRCGENAGFRYATLIGMLRRTRAAVTALNYHPAASLVERFMRHVGFAEGRIPQAEMLNISLSPKALVAALAVNNVAANLGDRQRYRTALQRLSQGFAPSGDIFGAEAAREADWSFEADRQFLAANFGIQFPRRDLHTPDAGLFLDDRELEEIRAVTCDLGADGHAIVEFARRFRRS
jgi:hypothetical protein